MKRARKAKRIRNPGFFESLELAVRILRGTLRLLRIYPKLVLPLAPVFLLIFLVEFGLLFVNDWITFGLAMAVILGVAFGLMLSFAISSSMLRQIHLGREPSLTEATLTKQFARLVPNVLVLSLVWYGIVLVLVIIQTIISIILDRIQDGLGEGVVGAIFGTLGDALRMAGFMMVAIMTFEGIGLGAAFGRLQSLLKQQATTALGGLALTKLVAAVIALLVGSLVLLFRDSVHAGLVTLIAMPFIACGWILTMYLEQMFLVGLYLYSEAPDSPVVRIMMARFLGKQLPRVPATSHR